MFYFSSQLQVKCKFHVVKFSALCGALENIATYLLIPWKCKISLPANRVITLQGRGRLPRVK